MAFDVLIVDDSQLFLDAARDLLERQGLRIVGLASTSAEAMRRSAELHPDVVLIDITLAGESGFELARQLSAPDKGAAALILISTHAREWPGRRHALKGGGPLSSPAGAW